MNVLIADDEPLARARLRALLEEIGGCQVVGEAANGREVFDFCKNHAPDVVLLDIGMPGVNGMEAARQLSALAVAPSVIFTTAYGEYALEAFEQNAVDYLLKPIRKDRLQKALERAFVLRQAPQAETAAGGARSHISTTLLGTLRLVPVNQVYYFRADQKYVTIRWKGGEALSSETLLSLEKEFAGEFLRIHRNALVALAQIAGIEKFGEGSHCISFREIPEKLEISRRHLSEVRRVLRDIRATPKL